MRKEMQEQTNKIRFAAIIGMGALGLLYADQITSGLGHMEAVEFVMDPDRAERHSTDIYTINGIEKNFNVTLGSEAKPADLVIVAVKYNSLPEALETMKNSVGPDTIILSVMNGVTSEKLIAERYGWNHMIYTVAQGMDAERYGSSLKYTQCGRLFIGATDPAMKARMEAVDEFLTAAGVPHVVEEDILHRMWFKYLLNVGFNQACAVYNAPYGIAITPGTEVYKIMVGAMKEVIPVAAAHGVTLTEEDVYTCIDIERTLDPNAYPSMAQDRRAGRKTEVEMFAGEMIRMAEEIGVEVPYNRFLMEEMRKIEM